MPASEGVIRFQLDYQPGSLPVIPGVEALFRWHATMHRLGLVGRDPARYEGYAYGNTSLRLDGMRFIITATQTGDIEQLTADRLAIVEDCDIAHNHVRASGPARPSSECMTHAAIYAAAPDAMAVIHVHSPLLWQQHAQLGMLATPAQVEYGTSAMAAAVAECVAANSGNDHGCIAMLGHEDGVICYAADINTAGNALVAMWEQVAGD